MVIKIGLTDAPPLWAASFRFLLAIAILWGIVVARGYKVAAKPSELLRLAHPGLYLYGASYALIYIAEQHISSALTSILFASFPLFVALLSLVMLKAERLRLVSWLGLALGFAGILVISWDSLRTSELVFLGTVLALLGSLASALGIIIHKKSFSDRNIYTAAALQMTLGGIPLLVAALIFEDISLFIVSFKSVGSVVYLAVFGTVIAFVGYYWLLARIRAIAASLIGFIIPIVAIFIGVILAGEALSAGAVIGTVTILSGVLLVLKQ